MAKYKACVFFIFCLFAQISNGWQLPPPKFIQDFATEMLCNSVLVYVPNVPNCCLQNDWLKYMMSG